MQIELQEIAVRDLTEGYVDSKEHGVRGYKGKLDIRPPYQREFIYNNRQKTAVIEIHDYHNIEDYMARHQHDPNADELWRYFERVIEGPGNTYVALAQREVAGVVGVPSAFAGPSEVVVVADGSADATFAAADLILQSEHGPGGLAWLVAWDEPVAAAVEAEVARLAACAERRPAGEVSAPNPP